MTTQLSRWLLARPVEDIDPDDLPEARLVLTAAEYFGLATGLPLEATLPDGEKILITLGQNPRSATAQHPTRGNWYAAVGPVFTFQQVADWLNLTAEELFRLVRDRKLLTVRGTCQIQPRLPVFQFAADGTLLPHLPEVLEILEQIYGEWGIARWLNRPRSRYGGFTAAWMLRHGDPDRILKDAQQLLGDYHAHR